jgi:hypothetical protein
MIMPFFRQILYSQIAGSTFLKRVTWSNKANTRDQIKSIEAIEKSILKFV